MKNMIDRNNKMDISVIQADITTLKVDVIVNAANRSLLGGGGVDGAIHRAAGPKLLEECKALHGAETGEVKATEGYNLQAKKIFHTPGPRWNGGRDNEKESLASCWRNSLELAKTLDMHSIAFPSISTGIYGYPLIDAARTAMNEVLSFLCENPEYELKVIVAAFDEKTRKEYEFALEDALFHRIPIREYDLNNNDIENIQIKNTFAFKIAGGGAMGIPGGVQVFIDDGEISIANGNFVYGNLDLDCLMKHLRFGKVNFGVFGDATNIPIDWRYVNLGAGNSLLIRDNIFNAVQNKYQKLKPSEIYEVYVRDTVLMQYFGGDK